MSVSASAPPPVVDGVDVEAVAAATRACRGVEKLLVGLPEVATYLPGRRVPGVRVSDTTVEVQLRAAWAIPAYEVGAAVQAAVAPLAGGRAVDVRIAELGDPPAITPDGADSRPTAVASRPGARLAQAAMASDKIQGDPLLAEFRTTSVAAL
ncbi:hypothetical protein Cme02nite_28650 [Catellatospora methionotrophica]|uniref:Asp23/Gls24 family envelope stress response protein n=1 Tax=Catellatospora methionotrophica TaxID=121620 RepID=A0A8J3LAB1_9ACTN|nr:hypothetical protein [Catellatospora methionotrophica]GIG14533.1 hypothetical protein Cme02nite_28650 [Catellatospora methionotrophica]